MRPHLILGPLLRFAGETQATVWVETDAPCEVGVSAGGSVHRSRTFSVEGHHYALVRVEGLAPGSSYGYTVALDGEKVWPEPGYGFPPSRIRTLGHDGALKIAFGSCRVSLPHEPPHTLSKDADGRGHGLDALRGLADRMRGEGPEGWPDALLLLGDQVYADEVSPATRGFIRARRDPGTPPGESIADFEEYTRLYRESWRSPVVRWLLSTVPSAMIFDDHDVHDDWNTSEAWVEKMRSEPWWHERIVGAFMSYWIYQHLGNLSPEELDENDLFRRVREAGDATPVLREFARKTDREPAGARWSFCRDFGRVRLLVVDSRAGRVVEGGRRSMVDADEWAWVEDKVFGGFDHLLIGTSLPFLLAPGLHHFEAWNEAVCGGAWGPLAAKVGEKIRQAADLEHWAAFGKSFDRLADLLGSVASGERSGPRGHAPASVTVLSGDVHHGYLAEVGFGERVQSRVYQAVSSPLRNPLSRPERLALGAGWTGLGRLAGEALARLAGAPPPRVTWRLTHEKPWFDNHVSTVELRGREASLKVEKPTREGPKGTLVSTIFERKLV